MIKAGIIGASGYAGCEVLRILLMHPDVEVVAVSARSYLGKKVSDLYPSFYQRTDLVYVEDQEVIEQADVIFASLPNGLSEKYAKQTEAMGKKIIDLGADFRLDSEAVYHQWYGFDYNEKELHERQVYGLPEVNRDKIKDATIIGNPGCYVTSILLGLYPLMKAKANASQKIIADSASGVTGAGKGLSDDTHFPKTNESYHPYKVGAHRHTPEIEQELTKMNGQDVRVTFVPHLLPVNRGIVSTIYVDLKPEYTLEDVYSIYEDAYKDEYFVHVLPLGQVADLKFIQYTNHCHISLHMDERDHTLIIASTIDNMVKGAAGQAVQNMNIMFGLDEKAGLTLVGPSF